MDFEKRLERAIVRGEQVRDARGKAETEKALTEDEFRALHVKHRLDLSEHIESCLKNLPDHFPGFQYQTVVGEDGWGARVSRDDMSLASGRHSATQYSRFEILVRPFSPAHLLEMAAKATIRNKEVFNRSRYQMLAQFDPQTFTELVDLWVLEYAELYAAQK